MWFDSHCHLQLCAEDGPQQSFLERARGAGVEAMVTVGIDVESSRSATVATQSSGVWAAAGVHPSSAEEWSEDAARAIDELVAHPRVVAVGESGLDFYRARARPSSQERAFAAHIEFAKKFDKALIIHTRASLPQALDLLEEKGPPQRFVFHCWSGDQDDLDRAVGMGAYISFAGNVSFANAAPLRACAGAVPWDRLLVETDAPFLTPVPHRGKPNEPSYVPFVGDALARVRSVPVEEIASRTYANACALFAIER